VKPYFRSRIHIARRFCTNMDHILLQSVAPRKTSQKQTQPITRNPSRQRIPSDRNTMVAFSYLVLNQYGNRWKYFDDNKYLPPYFETDPSNTTLSQIVEVSILAQDRTALESQCSPLLEAVSFTLHCAIKTQVGKHAAIEKVGLESWLTTSRRTRRTPADPDPPCHRFYKSPNDVCGQISLLVTAIVAQIKALFVLPAAQQLPSIPVTSGCHPQHY